MNQSPATAKVKSSKDLAPAKANNDTVSSQHKTPTIPAVEKNSHLAKKSPYNLRRRPTGQGRKGTQLHSLMSSYHITWFMTFKSNKQ